MITKGKVLITVLLTILTLNLVACSTTSTVTPQTPKQQIYALNGLITTIGQTTLTLYQNGKLTQEQVKHVYEGLSTAAYMLDQASALYYASNSTNSTVSTANLLITEVTAALTQLQQYINTAQKSTAKSGNSTGGK